MTSTRMVVSDQPVVGCWATRISQGHGQPSWVWRWMQRRNFPKMFGSSSTKPNNVWVFTQWVSTGALCNPANICTNWARESVHESKYGGKQDSNGYIPPTAPLVID
jgi:hypothetical protein